MKPKRDTRQGCYLIVTRAGRLYIGSVAGGKGRSFSTRWGEHVKELERGTHHNKKLQAAHDVGDTITFIPLSIVPKGNIQLARKIEGIMQRAIPNLCNEVKVRNGR